MSTKLQRRRGVSATDARAIVFIAALLNELPYRNDQTLFPQRTFEKGVNSQIWKEPRAEAIISMTVKPVIWPNKSSIELHWTDAKWSDEIAVFGILNAPHAFLFVGDDKTPCVTEFRVRGWDLNEEIQFGPNGVLNQTKYFETYCGDRWLKLHK